MTVLDVVPGHRRCIPVHRVFFHGVRYQCAAVVVLGQSREAVGPGRGDGGLVHLYLVRQQFDSDAFRPDAVLVIVVIPGLGAGDVHRFRGKAVGDVHSVAVDPRAHHRLGDAARRVGGVVCFLNRIGDKHAGRELGQAAEHIGPGGAFTVQVRGAVQFNAPHHNRAVFQVDGDSRRALAILVVAIIPGLGAADGDAARGQLVGKVTILGFMVRAGLDIARWLGFRHVVNNQFTVPVFGQVVEGIHPAVAALGPGWRRLRVQRHAVCVQCQRQALRARQVGVVIVHPGLGPADAGGARGECVDKVPPVSGGQLVARGHVARLFRDGIGHQLVVLNPGQFIERVGPDAGRGV